MVVFDSQTPQLRRAILDVMLAQDQRTVTLLTALERSDINLSEIDPTRQTRLMKTETRTSRRAPSNCLLP